MNPLRPLFIPLNSCFFEEFRTGAKKYEWRQYRPGWNEENCFPGRDAVLAYGYGWPRLLAVVRDFSVIASCPNPVFDEIFPGWILGGGKVAQIGIDVIRPLEHLEQIPLPLFRQ